MRRRTTLTALASLWSLPAILAGSEARAAHPTFALPLAAETDLERARELDASAARAYAAGRIRSALALFIAAYRRGAPPVALWNIARCHERLDELEDAAEMLELYLAAPDLSTADRAEATRALASLRRRPSSLLVDGEAAGATVFVDERRVGVAPLATELAPGLHTVRLVREGQTEDAPRDTRRGEHVVEARFGRLVLVASTDAPQPSPRSARTKRLELEAQGGLEVPSLGDASQRVAPTADVAFRVAFGTPRISASWGARAAGRSLTGRGPADPSPTGCALPARGRAVGLAGALTGGVAWDATRSLRASIELGGGLESLVIGGVGAVGGEAFVADCSPSPGLVPLGLARASASFRVAKEVRVVLTPVTFAVHPAYEGARSSPTDATGPWIRLGASLGLSYDVGL